MTAHFVLRDSHSMPAPMYLASVTRAGLKALFVADITKARRFSKDDILQHREEHPHITGRFVRRDAELKRIAEAAKKTAAPTGTPP
jgi:hypothetical protein